MAGCTLAWALRWRGAGVRLFDRGDPMSSSRVAAGIVNPITGPNLTLGWRFGELWPAAVEFYRRVEAASGTALFRQLPLVRLFDSGEQVAKWAKRRRDPEYAERVQEPPEPPVGVGGEFGGFEVREAGHLDTGAFLDATRAALGGDWIEEEFPAAGAGEGTTVFCEGFSAAANPLFDGVPFKPAKGEVLTLRCASLEGRRILNRGGVWVLPAGDGLFRAGATYAWGETDTAPTAAGRAEIEGRLARLIELPYEVVDHVAGVRPVIRASKLVMGLHPAEARIGFFNGLGSKGVLTAPYFAAQFAAHLCGEGEIDPEVDLRKNRL